MSKCDLIRDLLPLYVDGAASEESARAVEEHVAQCPECRQALEDDAYILVISDGTRTSDMVVCE